jgi:ABC-type polysaccharide/polyol phosphate export permease
MDFDLPIQDVVQAFKKWRLIIYSAWFDIKVRYRRSVLGPFWMTISTLFFVCIISVLYSHLFRERLKQDYYIVYLLCGFITWGYISAAISSSFGLLANSASYILDTNLSFSYFVFNMLTEQIIVFLHNLIVYAFFVVVFSLHIDWETFLMIPGFILLTLNLVWIVTLFSLLCLRFRDLPPIIQSLLHVTFFVSPITWTAKMLPQQAWLLKFNPIAYLLDIVRSPLLGHAPHLMSWVVAFAMFMIGTVLTYFVFAKVYKDIPFWTV